MTNPILEMMKSRNKLLTDTITALEKRMEAFPDGKIYCSSHSGGVHFLLMGDDSKLRYLNKNSQELIDQLIQKDYVQKAIKTAKNESDVLKKMIVKYPAPVIEDLFDSLPEERQKRAKPIVLGYTQDAKTWLSAPYEHKPFSKTDPEFYTIRGERVRSKSEVIIADRLWAKGIPYKYECPFRVGDEIIHPDFTILRLSDLKIVYHEHCGKMNDPKYTGALPKRINDYSHEGIILGDRLFLTFESDDKPLDLKAFDDLIEKHYR